LKGVAIGGFMGTGKSSVAPLIGAALALPVVDLDAELVRRFGPIADQFRTDGEKVFRERETALLASLCEGIPRVLATGGGAWVSEANQTLLERHFWRVVLTAPLDVIRGRVTKQGARPLWNDQVEGLLRSREAAYNRADLIVDTGDSSVKEVALEIVGWLRSQ
jgi:shikimate kinase